MQQIAEITEAQFQAEVLDQKQQILVDFYGADCVVCDAIAQWFDDIEDELTTPVCKVFLAAPSSVLAQQYNLRGIPTLIRFESGVETDRMAGEFSLDTFRQFVLG